MTIPSKSIADKSLDLFTRYRELGLGLRDDSYIQHSEIYQEQFSTTEKVLSHDLDALVRGALGPAVRKLAEKVPAKAVLSTSIPDLQSDSKTLPVSNRLAVLGCKIEEVGEGYQVTLSVGTKA